MVATPLTRSLSSHLATSLGRSGVSGFPPPPLDNSNVILRTLSTKGFISGTHLPDELRYGTVRELQPGRAVVLNGTNQYVAGPTATSPATWSAACWVYPLAVGAADAIFSNRTTAINWYIGTNASNQLYVSGDGTTIASGTTDFVINTWQHLAVTYDGTTIRFYRNGVQVASSAFAATVTGGSVQMRIGYDQQNASYYNARLFEAYWAPSQVLTAAQVLLLYQHSYVAISNAAGFFYKLDQPNSVLQQDSSGNGNHGTITNWATSVHYGGADVPYSWQNEVGFSADNGTNLIASPNDFSGWTATNTTYAANQEYEVGNTLVADRFFETTTNGVHSAKISQAVSSTSGTAPYTFVFDVKGIGRTQFYARVFNTGETAKTEALFDTSALTVTALAGTTFSAAGTSIESLGGGWYRCKLGCLPTASQTALIPAVFSYNGTTDSFIGDVAKGFYLANAKLVLGSTHTPRKESAPTTDALGNALPYIGKCPARPRLINSHCLTLNGSNQYVTVGTGTWDTDGTQAMEIEIVANVSNGSVSKYLMVHRENSGNYRGWQCYINGAGQLAFEVVNVITTNQIAVSTVAVVNDGQWHRFKVTYDGSRTTAGVVLYVDGIRYKEDAPINNLNATSSAPSVSSCFAARNAAAGNHFLGNLAYAKLTIGATVWEYTMAEGSGTNIYEIRGATSHAIVNAGTNWAVLQNAYHANITRGFRTGVNLCKYSEQIDNAIWTKSQVTLTADAGTIPGAAASAENVVPTAVSSQHFFHQSITYAAGTANISAYVKANGYNYVSIYPQGAAGEAFALFNLQNGTVVSTGGAAYVSSGIESLGDSWYRINLTFNTAAAAGLTFFYINATAVAAETYVGNTTSGILFGQIQLSQGSSVQTYFATDAANGQVKIPLKTGTLLAANGLAITNTAGAWHNMAETAIDFTCGESAAPIFNGQTITDIDDYVTGRSVTLLQKVATATYERQYQLRKP